MPNISGILSGITKNADKLGTLAGFMTGSPNGFGDVQSIIENVLAGNIHAPDIMASLNAIASEPFVKTGIMTWLIGYVMNESGVSQLKKFGTPLQKFGMGYAMGSAVQKILWMSTHSDQGSASHLQGMFNRAVIAPNQNYGY